jgi:hypothetical protein
MKSLITPESVIIYFDHQGDAFLLRPSMNWKGLLLTHFASSQPQRKEHGVAGFPLRVSFLFNQSKNHIKRAINNSLLLIKTYKLILIYI